ncbi:MAG: hypothetical protein JWO92_612 [Chitinophagaceae bacterium]|nr:hypothetical protein [Chitinophagaceae bacterium]
MKFSTVILIIAIIIWGVLLGGVVYSHIVYFPAFLSNLPDSSALVNGKYALHDEKFWMAIHPVLIVLLIVTIISNWKNKPRRKKILISFVLYAVVLIVTSIYFIPELISFSKSATSSLPPSEWLRRSNNWMTYSIIRGIVMFAGIVPLFIALLKPGINNNQS